MSCPQHPSLAAKPISTEPGVGVSVSVCVSILVCVCDFALLSRLQLEASLISPPRPGAWQVSLQLTYWWRDWGEKREWNRGEQLHFQRDGSLEANTQTLSEAAESKFGLLCLWKDSGKSLDSNVTALSGGLFGSWFHNRHEIYFSCP